MEYSARACFFHTLPPVEMASVEFFSVVWSWNREREINSHWFRFSPSPEISARGITCKYRANTCFTYRWIPNISRACSGYEMTSDRNTNILKATFRVDVIRCRLKKISQFKANTTATNCGDDCLFTSNLPTIIKDSQDCQVLSPPSLSFKRSLRRCAHAVTKGGKFSLPKML